MAKRIRKTQAKPDGTSPARQQEEAGPELPLPLTGKPTPSVPAASGPRPPLPAIANQVIAERFGLPGVNVDSNLSEEALREGEQDLRRFYEARLLGVFYWNMNGEIADANDKFLEMVGFDREDLYAGQINWINMTPPEYRHLDEESIRELKNSGVNKVPFEKEYIRKDGSRIPVIVAGAMLDDARFNGVAFVLDITDRKKAEAELRESRNKYQALIETTSDFIWETDSFGRYTYCSPQMEKLWGFKPEKMLGKTPFDVVPEEHKASAAESFVELMKSPRPFSGLESAAHDGDGRLIYIETSGVPFFDDDGKLLGFRGISRDITQRKQAEEALKELNETLEQRVAQRTEELARSNQDLQQFAYIASHDLQEPLRMVAGFLKLLNERYSPQLDDKAREFIAYSVEGARRMSQLISDLLAYSRITSQGKELRPIEVKTSLDGALANLREVIQESGAIVTQDQLPTVLGDLTQLMQLLQNLVGNAIKFRSPDRPCQIHVGAQRRDDCWIIYVCDNGIGIDPGQHERIFVIFQRLHTREKYTGTGIGLAICKKIVERHGGRIWVESQPGQGSTFYFSLREA